MGPNSTRQSLDGYLGKEFEVLSQAHFQTSQKTTNFFQFIAVIFLAPFAIFAVPGLEMSTLLGGILLVIGLLGFFVTMYLADLRFESLLYARGVNKIRFLINSKATFDLSLNEQVSFIRSNSLLLAQPRKPNYFDTNQFLWIVLGLGVINSFYLTYSVRIFLPVVFGMNLTKYWFIFVAILFSLVHVYVYYLKSKKHEEGSIYFRNIIGSDIDGVISDQVEHFIKFYNLKNEVKISQEDIITLPFHKSGKVSLECEREVFLDEEYWKTIEVLPTSKTAMSQLKNNGYKISLFTSRPWALRDADLPTFTRDWLTDNEIAFDNLIFDNKKITRIDKAQSMKIKYFIEDDISKAVKLCAICKVVFLIDYRYNQADSETPYNLVRVKNLGEIVDLINYID
jgi:uncharacterized HAD superfamily protein